MANPFVHLELNTPDLTKAKEFYSALFGWQFQDMDMGARPVSTAHSSPRTDQVAA